tara:strand:+ start:151943 stop:153235 length:1293 start_codon:yes stop_codon:yes gene_type:complete
MKTNYLLATLLLFLSVGIVAQEPQKKEMKPFEIDNKSFQKSASTMRDAFKQMFKNAIVENKHGTGSCKPEDLVNKISIDGLMSEDENLVGKIRSIKKAYLNYPQQLTDAISRDDAVSFDTRKYKTIEDGALSSFSNTNNFADFVKVYTGEDIGKLNEYDLQTVRGQYDDLKANYNIDFYIETENFMSLACSHKEESYIKLKKLDYPNATWEIRTIVTADCDCSLASDLTQSIKGGSVEYSAETTGLLTTSAITFGKVINAKVKVKSLDCCPEKEEKPNTALNDSNDANGYFQIGAHIGLPLGKEKDFYSVVLGADASYLFNISDNFSAGPRIGYNHFSGKDMGGYKVDGIGFVPASALIKYSFTKKIAFEGTIGYTFSTKEHVDGGINYGVGVELKFAPKLTVTPQISFTDLGDSGNFNWIGICLRYYNL